MGTNYFVKLNRCEKCGRAEEEVHLGKSSFGWKFALQYNGGRYYQTWAEMKSWLKGKIIEDEYGERVPVHDFIALVEAKKDTAEPQMDTRSIYSMRQKIIDGYKFYDVEFS